MYRKKYGINRPRPVPFKKGPKKCGKKRNSNRNPYYGKERRRPRAADRDLALWILAHGEPVERKPDPVVDEPDTDEEEVVEVPAVEVAKELHVKGIDLHIDENTKNHHTQEYGCTEARTRTVDNEKRDFPAELVIRRGFEFKMTIEFDRPYDIQKNDIRLSFRLDDDPKLNQALQPSFRVNETGKTKYKPKRWGATVVEKKGNSLTLNVFVPASAVIGEWEFSVRTATEREGKEPLYKQYNHNEDINIIFNPWCKEDWVYMEDEKWREETVLNDYGVQYRGSHSSMGVKPWFFGQFEDMILDCAFHLVRKGFGCPAAPAMGNAARVARIISQIVNDFDDVGVLSGNWSGNYEGGTPPGEWCGSVRILQEYMRTGKPVKYGQCWVFSAVVTTVCRALGIPCRSITNFASAHNTDMEHLSIDKYTKGTNRESSDSVWNFHVWNEVWMQRPDLSEAHEWDGWQVIDATPQELSDGVYCCGPAPVKAIKEGELRVGYDTAFIFAEVNADKCWFGWDKKTEKLKEIKFFRESAAVGKNVSTHRPTGEDFNGALGNDDADRDDKLERCDLTNFYKYDEGSDKEREIVKKAEKMFRMMNGCTIVGDDAADEEEDEEDDEDVVITGVTQPPVTIEIEKPLKAMVGDPFSFKVNVTNPGSDTVALKDVVIKVMNKTYDDQETGTVLRRKEKDIYLDGKKNNLYPITVGVDSYCTRPQDGFNFDLRTEVSFYNGDVITKVTDFRLRRPDVELSGPASCKLGEKIKVELTFTNPLAVPLTKCKVKIDGGFDLEGLEDDTIEIDKIDPKARWKQAITMVARRHPRGKKYRSLSVGLNSKQLEECDGRIRVELKA